MAAQKKYNKAKAFHVKVKCAPFHHLGESVSDTEGALADELEDYNNNAGLDDD